jgi:hypothetical protein
MQCGEYLLDVRRLDLFLQLFHVALLLVLQVPDGEVHAAEGAQVLLVDGQLHLLDLPLQLPQPGRPAKPTIKNITSG